MPIQSVLQASQDSKIHATSTQPSHLLMIYRVFVILPMLGVVQYLCGPYSLCFLRMTFWSLSWNKTVSPALGALCSSKLKRRQRMLNVSPLWTAWNLRILEWPSDSTNHRGGAVQKFVFKKPSIQEWSAMLAGIFGTHFRHGTENIYKKLQDDLRSTGISVVMVPGMPVSPPTHFVIINLSSCYVLDNW